FFFLDPYLAHPWYHFAYWLSMYFVLFFVAPCIFIVYERRHGGRLPVQIPLTKAARLLVGVSLIISLVCSLSLFFRVDEVSQALPWTLPSLVGGLIGVLFATHTAAFAWALWDGDWLRVRPMFWQAPPTGVLLILLPLIHGADLRPDTDTAQALYYIVIGSVVLANLGIILSYRPAELAYASHVQ
ncbi:MAG: hypothetical protein GYB65_16280, partial [Chloroflexi bacterium]|nr:hypothetical protein [Chloroflexota bacterium]